MNDSVLSPLLGLAFAWRRAEILLEFGGTPALGAERMLLVACCRA